MADNNRLIVLDDEPDVLATYRAMLTPAPSTGGGITSTRRIAAKAPTLQAVPLPFEVSYVSTGLEALEHVKKQLKAGTPFAGGFFDVKLGAGIDGIETICSIKEIDPNFRCVIVTAYQDRTVEEIRKLFGDNFSANWDIITKPFFRLEILQKAFNICANWNEHFRLQERFKLLNSGSKQQKEMLNELIEMINRKVIGKVEFALGRVDPEEIKTVLRSILADTAQIQTAVAKLTYLTKEEEKDKAA